MADRVSLFKGRVSARAKVSARLPGLRMLLVDMRDSGDPDRIADGAFLLGALDDMAAVQDETMDRLRDAAMVIERMANGASRSECSPELDRVIHALREIDGDGPDELQQRADEIHAADRAQDFNHGRDDDARP